jgi:predicted AAA+ superfamily ATPase
MIGRQLESILRSRVLQTPVVALLGSRQVGKTTLARALKVDKPTHYLELHPLNRTELESGRAVMEQHWFRGGYPDSFLAADDTLSNQWREDFITSYVERYLPQLGITAAPLLLRRLCSMLAHQQGATLNLSKMAGSLGIDGKTARHYIDLLAGLYLVRSLPAWSRNAGKRLVKSPKVYWRDSGLLHTLAGLHDLEQVLGHPLCGHSWEGYCLEQILTRLPVGHSFSHYRTHAGAEVDLVIETPQGEIIAIEIKRTLSPKLTPGFLESLKTLGATRGYFLIPDGESYPLSETVTATSLSTFLSAM